MFSELQLILATESSGKVLGSCKNGGMSDENSLGFVLLAERQRREAKISKKARGLGGQLISLTLIRGGHWPHWPCLSSLLSQTYRGVSAK